MRRGLAIVALLGHRLEIVPGIHQRIVTMMRVSVIDHGCDMTAAALA